MDFTVGEKVRIIDETGYGIVKEVLNSNLLLVETDYGFEIKKEINQIVKIYSEDYSQINENLHLSKNRNKSSLKSINKSRSINEIDLHIHEIIDSERNLTNFEKLQLQISTLDNFVRKMVKKRIKSFVVIHGVGEGVLKEEVLSYFRSKRGFFCSSADYRNYGKGATKVELRYTMIEDFL